MAATTQPHTNRQFNSDWHYKQDHCPQKGQNDGHETVVAKMSWFPKAVLLLLGCRVKELGRLQYKTPSRHLSRSPPSNTRRQMECSPGIPSCAPTAIGYPVNTSYRFPTCEPTTIGYPFFVTDSVTLGNGIHYTVFFQISLCLLSSSK